MLVIMLLVLGVLSRLFPHPVNFTPVAAIAIFGSAYLRKPYSLLIPLCIMAVSDMLIGMHDVVLFTWGAIALISLIGQKVKFSNSIAKTLGVSVASSILFYLISNFGVWLAGWYPKTISGLISCYVMGLPFLRNFTIATVLFTFAFIKVYAHVRIHAHEPAPQLLA